MPVSAESQTESDNESDNDPVKSAVEQQKFIVFEENLDNLFLMSRRNPLLKTHRSKCWIISNARQGLF